MRVPIVGVGLERDRKIKVIERTEKCKVHCHYVIEKTHNLGLRTIHSRAHFSMLQIKRKLVKLNIGRI